MATQFICYECEKLKDIDEAVLDSTTVLYETVLIYCKECYSKREQDEIVVEKHEFGAEINQDNWMIWFFGIVLACIIVFVLGVMLGMWSI